MTEAILPIKTCRQCGVQFSGRKCQPCANASSKRWALANPDKVLANREKNREKARQATIQWRKENPGRAAKMVAEWRDKNPEVAKERALKYRIEHRDHCAAKSSEWREKFPERFKESIATYRLANPEIFRVHGQNRRARVKSSGEKLSFGLVDKLFKLQRGMCPCCAKPLGEDFHLDHRMPLALGGLNVDSNMQLLRNICNRQKHAKHPGDFMRQRGFLI